LIPIDIAYRSAQLIIGLPAIECPLDLPSREQVKERHIDQFKASIDKALEQSDLSIYSTSLKRLLKNVKLLQSKWLRH
jgi:hypothetical protein